MADAPPLDLDEAEIVVNKVDTIASFRAPDRNANQIKLEEHFSNLGPSTPENLVHQLETRICDHTIQQLHDAVKPIVSYGVHWANHQLYKKAIKENQAFLSALSNRGLRKYEANVEEKKQQKQDKEQKKAEGSSSHPQGNSQKETKQEAPKAAPFAEQARKEFEEGDPVTLSHMRVAGNCLSERPIHMYDANGKLLEAIGNYKSGEPIALRLVTDTKGNLSHIEPINLTDDQRKQHDSLDHTQNDCGLNALFVHLPKEKQAQVGDARGMRNFCADHMRKNPQRYDGLFKYEMRLSQMDPAQVPRAGCMEERLERQFGNDPNDTLFRHSLWMHNPDYQSAEWLCEAAKEQGDIESAQKWSQLCDTIAVEESERIKAEAPRTLFRGIMHMGQLASIFFGNPPAFRGFSMGLKGEQIFSDDLLREHVKNREMAGVWERGQDHLPLWGPVRNSARSLARKEYIRSILHAADFELDARLIRDLKGCSKPGGGGAVATKIPSQVKNILKNPESFKGAPAKNAMMEIDKHVPPHWIRDTARKGRGVRWYDPKNKGNSIMVEYGNKKSKDPTGLHKGPYLRITKNGEEIRVPLETNPVLMTE
jgi:hypothetical protein